MFLTLIALLHLFYMKYFFLVPRIMPFIDLQSMLGINLDKWLLAQSGEQPQKRAARCHAFEKEWIECAHGIGQIRAKKECKLELEDFYECMHRRKTVSTSENIQAMYLRLYITLALYLYNTIITPYSNSACMRSVSRRRS